MHPDILKKMLLISLQAEYAVGRPVPVRVSPGLCTGECLF